MTTLSNNLFMRALGTTWSIMSLCCCGTPVLAQQARQYETATTEIAVDILAELDLSPELMTLSTYTEKEKCLSSGGMYKAGRNTILEMEHCQDINEEVILVKIPLKDTILKTHLPKAHRSVQMITLELSARHYAGTVYLNCFSTSSQRNCLLVFERSDSGENFHTVAIKKQASSPFPLNVSYPCMDTIPPLPSTVYRVLHMGDDGAFQYSDTTQVIPISQSYF